MTARRKFQFCPNILFLLCCNNEPAQGWLWLKTELEWGTKSGQECTKVHPWSQFTAAAAWCALENSQLYLWLQLGIEGSFLPHICITLLLEPGSSIRNTWTLHYMRARKAKHIWGPIAEGIKPVLTFSDGLSFLSALLYKVCCSAIIMKGEPREKQGEEKLKKKKKISAIEKTAHVGRGSGAAMFPWVLIAHLLWNCFDSHIYSRRGISERRWWRLKRKDSWSFETGEEMQLHGSRDVQNIVSGKNHTFY